MDDLNLPAKRTKLQQKADLIRSPIKSAVLCKEDVSKNNLKSKKKIFNFFYYLIDREIRQFVRRQKYMCDVVW